MNSNETEGGCSAVRVDRRVRCPRLRTIQQSRNTYLGRYKGHVVDVSREAKSDNWYIIVTAPNGCYSYDGWWGESAGKPKRAAILEALEGAMLWTPNVMYTPHGAST